jgi:hypothetical protein
VRCNAVQQNAPFLELSRERGRSSSWLTRELMLTYSVEQSDGAHRPIRPSTSRTRKMTRKM